MKSSLHLLPTRRGTAAENMAWDQMMLEVFPDPEVLRLRCYGWSEVAYTLGYSQAYDPLRKRIGGGALVRRATGGGLVDHRRDWTYALVIPSGHAWHRLPALEVYQRVHACLAAALAILGVETVVFQPGERAQEGAEESCGVRSSRPAEACFQRAECYDLVHARTGKKLAGAAQKRTRVGLLHQGSVDCTDEVALHGGAVRRGLVQAFSEALAGALDAEIHPVPWPAYTSSVSRAYEVRFASHAWNAFRTVESLS